MKSISNNLRRASFLVLFLFLTFIKSSFGQTIDVPFPYIVSGNMEYGRVAININYTMAPQIRKINTDKMKEKCPSKCTITIVYGYIDANGNDITLSAVGRYQSLGNYWGDSTLGGGVHGTWEHFFKSLIADSRLTKTLHGHGGITVRYFNDLVKNYNVKSVCMKFVYSDPAMASGYANLPQYDTCTGVPPSTVSCSFTSGNIDFAYGSLEEKNAAGAVLKKDVNIKCTGGSAQLSLRLSTEGDEIPLSNGMAAKILFNGHALNKQEAVSIGDNVFSLSSTLSGVPDSTGPFTGSSVLLSDYF